MVVQKKASSVEEDGTKQCEFLMENTPEVWTGSQKKECEKNISKCVCIF